MQCTDEDQIGVVKMSINQMESGNSVILKVEAESLVKDEAMLLKTTALSVIDSGQKNIKLDLSATRFIDSSGIGKLLFLNKKLENEGGTLEITAINDKLYEFLDSLAINKIITVASPE